MANGIYSHEEIIDSAIVDCNTAVRFIVSGNYIAWCKTMTDVVQKLTVLKDGIKNDLESKNKNIEELKEQMRRSGVEIKDIPIEEFINKDGADNGIQ